MILTSQYKVEEYGLGCIPLIGSTNSPLSAADAVCYSLAERNTWRNTSQEVQFPDLPPCDGRASGTTSAAALAIMAANTFGATLPGAGAAASTPSPSPLSPPPSLTPSTQPQSPPPRPATPPPPLLIAPVDVANTTALLVPAVLPCAPTLRCDNAFFLCGSVQVLPLH